MVSGPKDLADETLFVIFLCLGPADVLNCQLVCKRFNDMVLSSSFLRLSIELAFSGYIESCNPRMDLSLEEKYDVLRLHRLRRWNRAISSIDIIKMGVSDGGFRTRFLPYQTPLDPHPPLKDGVLAEWSSALPVETSTDLQLDIVQLPSLNTGMGLKRWQLLQTGLNIRSFDFEPNYDLLVLLEYAGPLIDRYPSDFNILIPNPCGPTPDPYLVHFRTLSTNECHPGAFQPILDCDLYTNTPHGFQIQYLGRLVTVRLEPSSFVHGESGLLIYNWVTGALLDRRDESYPNALVALSEKVVVIPRSCFAYNSQYMPMAQLELYYVDWSDSSHSKINLTAILDLPIVHSVPPLDFTWQKSYIEDPPSSDTILSQIAITCYCDAAPASRSTRSTLCANAPPRILESAQSSQMLRIYFELPALETALHFGGLDHGSDPSDTWLYVPFQVIFDITNATHKVPLPLGDAKRIHWGQWGTKTRWIHLPGDFWDARPTGRVSRSPVGTRAVLAHHTIPHRDAYRPVPGERERHEFGILLLDFNTDFAREVATRRNNSNPNDIMTARGRLYQPAEIGGMSPVEPYVDQGHTWLAKCGTDKAVAPYVWSTLEHPYFDIVVPDKEYWEITPDHEHAVVGEYLNVDRTTSPASIYCPKAKRILTRHDMYFTPTTEDIMTPTAIKTESVTPADPPLAKSVAVMDHPLDPLSTTEISKISTAVRYFLAAETPVQAFKFLGIDLVLPPKRDVLAHLGIRTAPGAKPDPYVDIVRKADVDLIDVISGFCWLVHLSLKNDEWNIDSAEKLPEGRLAQLSVNELIEAAEVVRKDERVRKLAADVGVAPDQIFADGWSLGYDDRFPQNLRLQQCVLYARFEKDENFYAHPLDFVPVIDSNAQKVIHIDFPSHPTSNAHLSSGPYSTKPPSLTADPSLERKRIPPPTMKHEYLPDRLGEPKVQREPLKPLHIVQPEGTSFRMTGRILEWQQWKMHIGFTPREGIVLSTVTYSDGGDVRPIFYRMSCAEMLVPYGSPDHPHSRKFAFDFGEYGVGLQANELSLGCDCLGAIHYLSGSFIGHDGNPLTIKNAICIHEEDAGLLWKHTDYRPGGRSHSVRSRKLVVSMVCTLGNYEYAFYWNFYLDGTIELEIRLTGILNVYMLAEGEKATFGTQVAPRINAHNHQHLFSVRIDPMIDGIDNTVIESDVVPYPHPAGSAENYAGNGFISLDNPILKASGRDYKHETDRRWRIVNPSKLHYSSGLPVAYSVGIGSTTRTLFATEGSWIRERAAFGGKALWVIPEDETTPGGRRWPAGRHVPQSRSQPKDSVAEWASLEDNVENADVLLFLTVGTNHIPRPEDWPVMPVEHVRVVFKPIGFFNNNPSLDVKAPTDECSRNAFPTGDVGTGAVVVEHPVSEQL